MSILFTNAAGEEILSFSPGPARMLCAVTQALAAELAVPSGLVEHYEIDEVAVLPAEFHPFVQAAVDKFANSNHVVYRAIAAAFVPLLVGVAVRAGASIEAFALDHELRDQAEAIERRL
jgi:hypothetical protein